jgi:hypothetical protein
MELWASYLITLCQNFLISKMETARLNIPSSKNLQFRHSKMIQQWCLKSYRFWEISFPNYLLRDAQPVKPMQIFQTQKKKSEILLVPSILDKGYSTYLKWLL